MALQNYSLQNLDEILHKSIALNKMSPNDPKFGDCLFELHDLMRAKGDVGIISNIISEVIRIHRDAHCHDHKTNESLSLGNDQSQDDVEHVYYDEDDDSDYDLDESLDMIRNLRTVNLITRGLPRNLIARLPTLECAYTIWRFLEERFPNYSLQNLDEILYKST